MKGVVPFALSINLCKKSMSPVHPFPLIGAHLSISGGVHQALVRGQKIGATTLQLFTANQRQWGGRPFSLEECAKWKEQIERTHMQQVMSHASFLINLGSNKEEILSKGRLAFDEEILRSIQLGLAFVNVHPGAATGDNETPCLDRIVESLIRTEPLLDRADAPRLLLETTAGQGTTVGYCFEHLAYLIERTKDRIPIGICLDTCHIFAAGYDIRTARGWHSALHTFDRIIGIRHLYAIHVNDSLCPLGSRKDRHASLGKGEIGLEGFKAMMSHPDLQPLPKYLETPEGETVWEREIHLLRSFCA